MLTMMMNTNVLFGRLRRQQRQLQLLLLVVVVIILQRHNAYGQSNNNNNNIKKHQYNYCTEYEVLIDNCPFRRDGVCDAGQIIGCDLYTDCFDCDPCRVYDNTSCEECTTATTTTNANCQWCITSTGYGVCSTSAYATALPDLCIQTGGTAYSSTCTEDNINNDNVCDIETDTCTFAYDLICDADGILCSINNSDCFDCDPCQEYKNNCETCIANGCSYCYAGTSFGGICSSTDIAALVPTICTNEDGGTPYTTTTCPTIDDDDDDDNNTPPDDTYTCDIQSDTCQFQFDLECDANSACDANTDCFDCDPCQQYNDDCTTCVTNTNYDCQYCTSQDGSVGLCSSTSIVSSTITDTVCDPNIPYSNTCPGDNDNNNNNIDQCNIDDTTCEYQFDLLCDADGTTCAINTDCFDCDVCQQYNTDCETCTTNTNNANETCVYCETGTGLGVCSSPTLAKKFSTICSSSALGGTLYTETCTDISNNDNDICSSNTDTDPCPFSNDGNCDANGLLCPFNSDCFDCDICQQYRYDGCETCTSNGCLWCPYDALCISTNTLNNVPFNKLTCNDPTNFTNTCTTIDDSNNPYNDRFYDAQSWIYEMINVRQAWADGYTGTGIGIRVNDDGVDDTHPDISSKFDVASSCSLYAPAQLNQKFGHGTACAAFAAASGNNTGGCSVGIAPDATISGCRAISSGAGEDIAPEAYDDSHLYSNMDNMHISSNSWGTRACGKKDRKRLLRRFLQQGCPFSTTNTNSPCTSSLCSTSGWDNGLLSVDCENYITQYCQLYLEEDPDACFLFLDLTVECSFYDRDEDLEAAVAKGVFGGRDGKGIIYVFASGNYYRQGADVNYEDFSNLRYTISVGSVGKDGNHASYSTPGAALLLVAPGGDFESYTNNVVAKAGGGCSDTGVGTSFAAPIVSGVTALILQANPDLSWRDVQGILVTTSQKTDPNDPTWTTNAVGLHHSYLYGFGIVDASAAVNAAKTWDLYATESAAVAESGAVNIPIPEYPADPIVSTVTLQSASNFVAESVMASINLEHSSRGDLQIILTSPSGTESILVPGSRPENSQRSESWRLMTVRSWGEPAAGDWSLSIMDAKLGDVDDCVDYDGWTMALTGDDCGTFGLLSNSCVDGSIGPDFLTYFDFATGGLSDPALADANGVTPDIACCACGGGQLASSITDLLLSWELTVYGHVSDSTVASPVAAPTLAPVQSPVIEAPVPLPTAGPTQSIVPPVSDSETPQPISNPTTNAPVLSPDIPPTGDTSGVEPTTGDVDETPTSTAPVAAPTTASPTLLSNDRGNNNNTPSPAGTLPTLFTTSSSINHYCCYYISFALIILLANVTV